MRILENYLTGLKKAFSDDSGEHPEAVALVTNLSIEMHGRKPEARFISIQAKVWHNEEVFSRDGQSLHIKGRDNIFESFEGENYLAELDSAPLTMLILARHLQRKLRSIQVTVDAEGNPVTLEDAEAIPLPESLDTPELQQFLAQFDQIEQQMVSQIEATKEA